MALSYVGYASAAANSVALPAFTVGDLALVFAYRDGSNTAPALPAGWTNIASSGANTNSSRVGRRVLQPGDTTTGAWTNATEVQVLVVRGQHLTSPIGAAGALPSGATASNRITYPTIQIFGDPVRSWIVGFCGHRTATNVNTGVIATFATRSAGSVTTSDGCHTRVNAFRHDIPADTYWFDTDGFDVNASAAWRSYMFELVEAAANQTQTAIAEVSLASGGVPTSRTAHSLHVRARKTNALDTGVMRLQLFEGATPRSAMLSTAALTTALADYAVNIADADAALIGSYTDLGVRFQGYSSEGTPTIFEVDQLWLETPEASAVVPPSAYPNVLMVAILPPDVVLGEPRIAAGGLVYLFGDSDLALPPPGTPRQAAGGLTYLFGDPEAIIVPPPPSDGTFGKTGAGVVQTLAQADHKFASVYSLTEAANVTKITLRCAQSGDAGTVTARCSIYADSGGTPGALLGTTQEHQITSPSFTWEDFPFTTPVPLNAGDYWLAFNSGHTGARLLGVTYDNLTNGDLNNADTYAGGDSDPFGAAGTFNTQWSLYATYTAGGIPPPPGGFPTTVLIDSFNRSNETPLAAPWAKTRPDPVPGTTLVTNQVAWNAAVAQSYHGSTIFGPDTEAWVTVPVAPTGTDGVSVTARISTPNTAGVDYYQGTYTNGVGWRIFRVDDNGYTGLGATVASPVLASGDSIGLEIIGSQIKLWHKTGGVWTAIKTESDSVITAAGYIGVEVAGASGRLDDFGGGTIGATGPTGPTGPVGPTVTIDANTVLFTQGNQFFSTWISAYEYTDLADSQHRAQWAQMGVEHVRIVMSQPPNPTGYGGYNYARDFLAAVDPDVPVHICMGISPANRPSAYADPTVAGDVATSGGWSPAEWADLYQNWVQAGVNVTGVQSGNEVSFRGNQIYDVQGESCFNPGCDTGAVNYSWVNDWHAVHHRYYMDAVQTRATSMGRGAIRMEGPQFATLSAASGGLVLTKAFVTGTMQAGYAWPFGDTNVPHLTGVTIHLYGNAPSMQGKINTFFYYDPANIYTEGVYQNFQLMRDLRAYMNANGAINIPIMIDESSYADAAQTMDWRTCTADALILIATMNGNLYTPSLNVQRITWQAWNRGNPANFADWFSGDPHTLNLKGVSMRDVTGYFMRTYKRLVASPVTGSGMTPAGDNNAVTRIRCAAALNAAGNKLGVLIANVDFSNSETVTINHGFVPTGNVTGRRIPQNLSIASTSIPAITPFLPGTSFVQTIGPGETYLFEIPR